MKKAVILIVFLIVSAFAKAQLGFCNGASSDAIFIETFGAGTTNGPPLGAGQTSYRYVNSQTQDGEYSISSTIQQLGSFHSSGDHTGDPNGKALIVNASFDPGQFYQTSITGLCGNTNYEFSAWIMNIYDPQSNACPNNEVPIQVRFEIWDESDTNRLAQGVMDPRFAENQPTWIQYGLTFTTAANQSGCILKMINEGSGGCGNDLAIDDIVFRTCGDVVQIENTSNQTSASRCSTDPEESITLSVNTTEPVYDSPVYQWQSAPLGGEFTDIPGANGSSYTTPTLGTSRAFRVKIAEDAVNLPNVECANYSDVFEYIVVFVPEPTTQNPQVVACDGSQATLNAEVPPGLQVNWYDSPTGGNLLSENSTTLQVQTPGTYYAESVLADGSCESENRLAIEFAISNAPVVVNQSLQICPNEAVILDPQSDQMVNYEWSTGESSSTITVSSPGVYTCIVTNADGCSATATFEVEQIVVPQSLELVVDGEELQALTNEGDFLYRFNDSPYQRSNTYDITGLLQVVVEVVDAQGCTSQTAIFNRLGLPEFFTPNNDGFNDQWVVGNINSFPETTVAIFDRFGKLIIQLNEADPDWNGIFNNEPLPSSDYWYKVTNGSQEFTGHFSLKR